MDPGPFLFGLQDPALTRANILCYSEEDILVLVGVGAGFKGLDLEPYNDIQKLKGSVTLLTIIWTCSRYGSRWISSYSSSYEGSNVGTALTVI
mgnify:CR=1 FL=1